MQEFLDYLRFADGFHMWGAVARMLLAVICGGIIGIERERKRRPAGFRTHILICLGASLTMLTSQYIYLELKLFTDLARLGAQVIAGIGFIGAGTIIVTKRRQVKGLTTAAGLWTSAIVGLAIGAGYFEAALIATALMIVVELVLSRLEYFIMSTAKGINLYIEYKEADTLVRMTEYLRDHKVGVTDLQITKSGAATKNPCAIFSLELPHKLTHDKLMTALAGIDGVVSVEEL
ncbi:MAG: MgtC/SapB family protein [Clostridia bacterium]|nr:MgtC/SapB family protein [Clostridia bacterium]MBQ8716323.1 MgtC/SapB family protein [Clostridia bacterium]